MMGSGIPVIQPYMQQQPPMMMPGSGPASQQPSLHQPTRITIQSQQENPDGTVALNNIAMDVYLLDQAPEVGQKLQQSIKFIQEGKNTEGMELLMALHGDGKIKIDN